LPRTLACAVLPCPPRSRGRTGLERLSEILDSTAADVRAGHLLTQAGTVLMTPLVGKSVASIKVHADFGNSRLRKALISVPGRGWRRM